MRTTRYTYTHLNTIRHSPTHTHTHIHIHIHTDRQTDTQSYWVHLGNSLKHLLTTRSVAINLTKP